MKKKILLVILLVVILLGAGVAYAYFATDMFKTEKEMFFSYIEKDDVWKGLEEEKATEYLEKQQKTAYTNKGKVSVNISGIEEEGLEIVNNSQITFEGKTDASKKMTEQNISVDLAAGVNVPIKLRRDGDTYGIQTNLLNSKFIAIRNEKLQELAARFDIDVEGIPDKIDFSQEQFTEEELKTLKDRYYKIIDENLPKELFSKEKDNNQTVIKLEMTGEKFIDILSQILGTVRNDEIILNKMVIEKQEFQSQIDELIKELKEIETNEQDKFIIKQYVEAKDVKKYEILFLEANQTVMNITIENSVNQIVMKMYEEGNLIGEFDITKQTVQNDVSYNMTMKIHDEKEVLEFSFDMQYKNLLALDNVEEIYNITLSYEGDNDNLSTYTNGKVDIRLNYSNSKTFTSNVEIDALNSNNAIIINDATDEEIQNLIISIYQNMGLM